MPSTSENPPQARVTVRRAGPTDAAALSAVAVRTFPFACPPHTTAEDIARHQQDELSIARFTHDLDQTGAAFHLAEVQGAAVGYTMLAGPCVPPDGTAGNRPVQLRRIYTDHHLHGSGVGGALLRAALHHARTHGYDQIWLTTNQENTRAIAFYQRHGFEVIGTTTFRVGSSVENDFVMARPL